jgi:hypothetical protein
VAAAPGRIPPVVVRKPDVDDQVYQEIVKQEAEGAKPTHLKEPKIRLAMAGQFQCH